MTEAPALLFVCVENSCRSQMAEAFARMHGGERVRAFSTGSAPSGVVNARAIEFLAERGYDLSRHVSKAIDAVPADGFAAVVSMGCGDRCPSVAGGHREDWDLPDPKDLSAEEFRAVRDEIERRTVGLIARVAPPG